MKSTKRIIKSFYLCAGLLTICLILITIFSGFRHEYKKFKQFILTFIVIILIHYILLDHVAFVIEALIKTKNYKIKNSKTGKSSSVPQRFETDGEYLNNPVELLKTRLQNLKLELNLSNCHKDENLNEEFRRLTQDFWLFGKYFFLVLILIVYSHNPYGYYNTTTMRRILNESYFTNYNLENVNTIGELYNWINDTLMEALNEGVEYDGSAIDEPGWVNFHLAKLLGVVRLQQIRHAKKTKGMLKLYFDERDYLPQWKSLKRPLPYVEKYWRIYYPWLSKHYEGVANWLMSFTHVGSLYSYSENNGYVAVLARNQKNSQKILNFLKSNQWLDSQTAAVFIDFTLYNIDSNMFTICSILVEQTPFGNLIWQISVQSSELLTNMNHIYKWRWCLFVFYTLQLIEFCKVLIVKLWFDDGFFKSPWNWVDLIIVMLNLLLFILIVIREYYVLYVMESFGLSKKLEYVDFRVASLFDYMATIIKAFLVCLTSLRIWKLLQFSSIFRIFNRTLYTSAGALFSTILGIHIFLFGIGLAAQIVNGSHTEIFSRYLKSVTSIMSFSFGFNSRTSPDDLSHGGGILGFILYLILMFVVAIYLINMFITLICDHFANAREERDNQPTNHFTYWRFLKMEYSFIEDFFKQLFPRYYNTQNHTVSENNGNKLNDLNKKSTKEKSECTMNRNSTEDELFTLEMLRTNHIQKVTSILQLQMELLQYHITLQDSDTAEDDDEQLREESAQ